MYMSAVLTNLGADHQRKEVGFAADVEDGQGPAESPENVTFPTAKLLIWKHLGRGVHWPFYVFSDETDASKGFLPSF